MDLQTPNTYIELFFGYSAIWLIIAFFIFRTVKQQARINHEVEGLKEELSQIVSGGQVSQENQCSQEKIRQAG